MPTSPSSFCEVCGRQVKESVKTVLIEGTIFKVCSQCSTRGKPYDPRITKYSKRTIESSAQLTFRQPLVKPVVKKQGYANNRIHLIEETFLSQDFGRMIREARMKKGLTHQQLGIKMSERASLLKRVEAGALKPDELLAKKLERYLQIKLYVPVDEQQG